MKIGIGADDAALELKGTLIEHLQELGYEVAAFGKIAHYGHNKDYGFAMTAFEGFHDYRGIPAAVDFLKKHDAANRSACSSARTGRTARGRRKRMGTMPPH